MFKEHEQVVLTAVVSSDEKEALQPGDVGTVVHVHPGGHALVVEFVALDGETLALATVVSSQARPANSADLTHARSVETAV